MRKLKFRITLLLFVIICMIISLFLIEARLFGEKSPSELLVDKPIFPTKWESGEIFADHIVWREISTKNSMQSSPLFGTVIEATRVWSDQGGIFPPKITEKIFKFDSSLKSKIYFWRYRPEIAFFNKRPNFMGFCNPDICYPRDMVLENSYSDHSIIVCAMGNKHNCQMWYYWAKYGQYLISILFFAPNQGLDDKNFYLIINEVENRFIQQITRP